MFSIFASFLSINYILHKMKRITFFLMITLVAMQSFAANVDRMTAQAKAEAFLKTNAVGGKMMAPATIQFVSQRTITNSANVNVAVMYVFNTADRFVIVSGEDRATDILAVGDAPIDFNNIPDNMQMWLDYYQRQIEFLQAHPGLVVEKMTAPSRAQSVSPLLTSKWDQQSPYWNQCVINGTQCLTGCPATSLAQVFYYWKYPTAETGVVPAYRYKENYWSNWTNVDALPSTTFDWANMKNTYGWGGTAASKAAVATLMRYVGQAEHMNYGANASGISSDSTSLIVKACKFFGYDNNVRSVKKNNYYGTYNYYTDAQWAAMIQAELVAGHPIVYMGISDEGDGGGHAFNVDGYTASSNLYHINWGWSGAGDGDFALNAFIDYEGWNFDLYQQMVIGIQPPGGEVTYPVLNVEPESLDFGTINTSESVSQTFTVSGINLGNEEVTFTIAGNGHYTVSPASLSAAEVAAGATITVTFAPTTGGAHSGRVNVAYPGAETKSVSLTGNANVKPAILVDPNEVNLSASVGETVTGTFTVTGQNLSGSVYLSVQNNQGGAFSINKSNITKATAMNGVEVTVTYSPKTVGTVNARVMLRSKDADTIYVALNGTAAFTKVAPVMLPADEQFITANSFRADWTDETPAAGVTSYTLEYATSGNSQVVDGITNKNYLLEDLIAGATYTYKVKALYIDGTESQWSNTQQVTLPQQGPAYEIGDVNHDGDVNISDVTLLIDSLLGGGEIFTDCADINADGEIGIADVTALIDMLLSGN